MPAETETYCYELLYPQWIVFNGMPSWSLISCREPLVAARPHVSISSWEFRVLAMCAGTSAYEMSNSCKYQSLQSMMSLIMYELHPLQLWVVPFLSNFVSDKTAGFTDWLYWSLNWWSESTSEELHSGGVRLFFEWYCLQTCLLLFFFFSLFQLVILQWGNGIMELLYFIPSLASVAKEWENKVHNKDCSYSLPKQREWRKKGCELNWCFCCLYAL